LHIAAERGYLDLVKYLKNLKIQKIYKIALPVLAGIGAICTVELGLYFQRT